MRLYTFPLSHGPAFKVLEPERACLERALSANNLGRLWSLCREFAAPYTPHLRRTFGHRVVIWGLDAVIIRSVLECARVTRTLNSKRTLPSHEETRSNHQTPSR